MIFCCGFSCEGFWCKALWSVVSRAKDSAVWILVFRILVVWILMTRVLDSAVWIPVPTILFHEGSCFSASQLFIGLKTITFLSSPRSNLKIIVGQLEQDSPTKLRTNVLRGSSNLHPNIESWSGKVKCRASNSHPRKQLSCAPNVFYRKLEALNKCSVQKTSDRSDYVTLHNTVTQPWKMSGWQEIIRRFFSTRCP